MDKKNYSREIELPEGVTVKFEESLVVVNCGKNEHKRELELAGSDVKVEGNKVIMSTSNLNKNIKKMIGSNLAHIKNMAKGVSEGHKYVLKICSEHFPMNVSVSDNKVIIKNFLGEKVPREIPIKENANVKVDNDNIIVESVSKEVAGQMSADIEQKTRRPGFDTRVFQDGIYIINKDGKELK